MSTKFNKNSKYLKLAVRYKKRHNPKRAIYYYKMAIRQGDSDAMNDLGAFYDMELKDYKRAIKYYKMGIKNRMFML